jgi:Kef-type K+ transport system membrane component KefB
VMGEMVAGILLGPSLLGWIAPAASRALFPAESLGGLFAISQIGLLVFMFLVGVELNPRLLRGKSHTAIVTSHASIVIPFTLGALLALMLYPRLSDASVGFTGFALFMGAAMSVTAFPVLARILTERGLLGTRVGAVAIACAAVDDVTAWCILAAVVAVVRTGAGVQPLWITLGGAILFVLAMLFVVRRALRWLPRSFERHGAVTQPMLAAVLIVALLAAWTTERIGVHALFGAFMAGAVLPKDDRLVHAITEKLHDFTVVLLLPLFFAFTGLRTSIRLLEGAEMWGYAALILLVAVVGKWGGSALAARATGMPWREAGAVGLLMNTRGLMELVILNVGLDIGVISPALFAMMVIMALATTFMTSPLLEWIYPRRMAAAEGAQEEPAEHLELLV